MTLKVNAVITLRVIDPVRAVIEVSNYVYQTSQFAQTTLRSVLGEVDLDELLAHREQLNQRIQTIIDGHTAAVRCEGSFGRGEAGRYAGIDAARDGEAGGS